jgi:glycosyltransferase involved in cell wall biosynthesis
MAAGNQVIAHDNPFNREVLGDDGLFFADSESLIRSMDSVSAAIDDAGARGSRARRRVIEKYRWDQVTGQYDELFRRL